LLYAGDTAIRQQGSGCTRVVRLNARTREMRKSSTVVVAAVGFLSLVGTAAGVADFVTPRKAAYCGVSDGEPPFRLICWRPSDALTLDMTKRGRAHKRIYAPNRGYYDPAPARVLRFGRTWRLTGYWKCVSRSTGLTCTNRSGHGWWVGRVHGSRLF
jgi:hypothetical protein